MILYIVLLSGRFETIVPSNAKVRAQKFEICILHSRTGLKLKFEGRLEVILERLKAIFILDFVRIARSPCRIIKFGASLFSHGRSYRRAGKGGGLEPPNLFRFPM